MDFDKCNPHYVFFPPSVNHDVSYFINTSHVILPTSYVIT